MFYVYIHQIEALCLYKYKTLCYVQKIKYNAHMKFEKSHKSRRRDVVEITVLAVSGVSVAYPQTYALRRTTDFAKY